jgi:aerobic-type carbon monoxide dehydrogenase small subunit (CoxS/CutS family)
MPRFKLTTNGKAVSLDVKHRTFLVHLLRDHPQSVSG